MNRLVLILALALPVMASAQVKYVDTLNSIIDQNWITGAAISTNAICDSLIVGDWGDWTDGIWQDRSCHKPKDTTRWYIKTIGDKCDTVYKLVYTRIPNPDEKPNEDAPLYRQVYERTITCKTDTTWAEKVQAWLRPEQLEWIVNFMEIKLGRKADQITGGY